MSKTALKQLLAEVESVSHETLLKELVESIGNEESITVVDIGGKEGAVVVFSAQFMGAIERAKAKLGLIK
jgi:hypothetical protein